MSRRCIFFNVLVLVALNALSCAPSAKRLNGLEIGMTRSDAIKAIGQPKSTTGSVGQEVLAYDLRDKPFGDGMIFPGRYYVQIRDGRVAGWHRDEQKDAVDRERAFQMNTAGPGRSSPPSGSLGGGVESVLLVKNLETDKVIIKRRNGTQYVLDIGVGALSIWRYEGREILVNSPNSFAGIGSSIILPGSDQTARIWSSDSI